MKAIETKDMLQAGVHFGHMKKKWNPKMRPYIFMEKKGIHIIDLNKSKEKLDEAAAAIKSVARSGRKIMFVATKKQAKDIVANSARSVGMPYVTERWLGGMMTNFATIRKSIKKMQNIDRMLNDSVAENITKKERLVLQRERDKLERVLGGIAQLNRLPHALFIVDVMHEDIAVEEAKRLNITTFGIVDTNSDPSDVDFPIPGNDDATKSIRIIVDYMTQAVQEGLDERKKDKDAEDEEQEKEEAAKEKAEEKKAASVGAEDEEQEEKPKKRRRIKKTTGTKKPASDTDKKENE